MKDNGYKRNSKDEGNGYNRRSRETKHHLERNYGNDTRLRETETKMSNYY